VSDWPYRFEILDVNELVVDESYQRPLTSFAKRIERAFDPALVGTSVVSRRDDGTQAVVDGQTRAAAIRALAGLRARRSSTVPCLVYVRHELKPMRPACSCASRKSDAGCTPTSDSAPRWWPETRRPSRSRRICDRLGYRIGTDKSREISAVAGLGEGLSPRTEDPRSERCSLLRKPWGEEYLPSGDMLRGVGYLLEHDTGINDKRLAARLAPLTPGYMQRRASELREGSGHGGGSDKYMAEALGAVYTAPVVSGRSKTCKAQECMVSAAPGDEYCEAHAEKAAEVRKRLHLVA
jgi:hypothetical protein